MKAETNIKPSAMFPLGDGSYHYNYNIEAVERENELGKIETLYRYDFLHLQGEAEYREIVKAVIGAKYEPTQETDLITGMISGDEKDKAKYATYRKYVDSAKEMVKRDLIKKD